MIRNRLIHIEADKISEIEKEAKANMFYLVALDAREIHNKQEYIDIMNIYFKFPESVPTIYDA